MKIAYFDFFMPYVIRDSDFPAGGASNEWLNWIDGLVLNGCSVGLVTFKGAKDILKDCDLNIEIIETYEPGKGNYFFRPLVNLYKIFISVRRYNPDVIVHEVAGSPTGILAFVSKLLRKKFIYRVANDIDTDYRIRKRLSFKQFILFRYGLSNSDLIVCQNSFQLSNIIHRYPNKKVIKLPNPIRIDTESLKFSQNTKRSYIAWVGIFSKQKNVKLLYEIAASLPKVPFRIAGSPLRSIDSETSYYLNCLKSLTNVQFVGYLRRNEIVNFLNNAIVLLNTSHYEGFSNTFLEAWRSGTPIITSPYVNPDHLIERYKLGFICSSIQEYRDTIEYLYERDNSNAYFDSCRKYVLENHNPKALAKSLINNIYDLYVK